MDTSSPFPDEGAALARTNHLPTMQEGEHGSFSNQPLRHLIHLIELASDAIIVRDADSRIISWNQGAALLYGWSAQEAFGHITHELLQTSFPTSRVAVDSLLATGRQWEGELIHSCKDGSQVIVESRQVMSRGDLPDTIAILEINRDITERKQREKREAQQSRDQLAIILRGVADGIIVYGPDSRIIYANEAASRMTGYASAQAMLDTPPLGITDEFVISDERGQPLAHSQLTHLRVLAGEPEAQAVMGYTRAGIKQPERWSLVKSRPVFDEAGKISMVVTITHDITDRMLTERRKDEFISMASHELKTPVTSLKGFTNVLQRRLTRQGDTLGLHYLARMDAQLDRLTTLINDLLDISRLQSGKLAFREEALSLDLLVAETVENMQAATSTHHLQVEGSTNASVFGDKERLGQVYINLLTNAIKYSPQAQKVIIHLRLDEEHEQAIVGIQDFGIGIEQSYQEQIFERFYQVTDPEEKTYPGLGIGLYISKEIVARHAGRIWVESNKGTGSTFFVALPLFTSDK